MTITPTNLGAADSNVRPSIDHEYASVPAELRARRIWLPFKAKPRRGGGVAKIPYSMGCRKAQYTNPTTWMDFETALRMVRTPSYGLSGLGVVLGYGLAGYDADHCIAPGRPIPDEIRSHIETLNSYTELSYSGTGVHCLFYAKLPPGGRRKGHVEMYDSDRYFVVTGKHIAGTSEQVLPRQRECEHLHSLIWPKEPTAVGHHRSDPGSPPHPVTQCSANSLGERESGEGDVVLGPNGGVQERGLADRTDCTKAPNGHPPLVDDARVRAVLLRDRVARHYWNARLRGKRNRSDDDFALACKLAFYCRGDIHQMDRLFRTSRLFRPTKWDRQFKKADRTVTTYGRHTIERACKAQKGIFWRPRTKPTPIKPAKKGRPRSASTQAVLSLRTSSPNLKAAEVAAKLGLSVSAVRKVWSRYGAKPLTAESCAA